jgi:hypothetical protein
MSRGLRYFAYLIGAWAILPAVVRAEDVKELKSIATAKGMERSSSLGPIHLNRAGIVIRNAEELVARSLKSTSLKDPAVQKEIEADVVKLLKVDAIDWKKQMILAIIGEDFESLKHDGKTLTATFIPFKEPITRAIPATPKVLILVERFEGEVKFVPKKK